MSALRGLGALVVVSALVGPASAVALERPVWSADGETVLGLDHGGRRLVAFEAASGKSLWTAAVPRRQARRLTAVVPAPDGSTAVVAADGELWLAEPGAQVLRRLTANRAAETEVAISPDGRHVAFLRGGELRALELATGREIHLSAPPLAGAERKGRGQGGSARKPVEFAWSPDSRSLAFLAAPGAPGSIGVIDLESPEDPRWLDLAPVTRRVESIEWRFDNRAIGVVLPTADQTQDELVLCHPEKLHCRVLAARPRLGAERGPDELEFLADGFLWSRADAAGDARLVLHDTLGRERSTLAHPGWVLTGVEAIYEDAHRAVVTARREGTPATAQRWLVLDLRGRAPARELATAAEERILAAPASARLLRIPLEDGRNSASRATIESVDGQQLAVLGAD